MSYSLGVDLGTTFVAAAVANASRVEMFTLGDRSVVTPAVVYLREDGTVVTGDAAGRRAVSNPDRVGREFKRRLGDPTPVMLGGAPHAVTALLASLLSDVVARVSATQGAAPDSMVLTHPANWGPFRRELFDEVPQLAGVAMPRMVTEPEAAAAHYAASRRLENGEIVAVYDLGGGTFDATVLRKRPEGIEILGSPEGIERLGGVDFDEAILAHVNYAAGGALSELDMSDPQTTVALARLRQDCVLAKEALSIDTETTIPVFLPHRHFDVRLTRSEFEDMIRAPIESTIGALNRTLRSAEVTPDELSAVLLVGGSSRIPLVARMVSEELGRPTVVDAHPKYAVALGAAALAGGPDGVAGGDGSAAPTTAFPAVDAGARGAAAGGAAGLAGALGGAAGLAARGGAAVGAAGSAPEAAAAPFSLPSGSGLPTFGPPTTAPPAPAPAGAAVPAAMAAPPAAPPAATAAAAAAAPPAPPPAPTRPTGP
ncbi:Hsp70 family protein, partial [Pseudonocardia sp. RS11V-5]|uniref:Hsp70 family protein n=2 Tax=Pseudonocardia TaxID=1847 RepID=UPI001E65CBA6